MDISESIRSGFFVVLILESLTRIIGAEKRILCRFCFCHHSKHPRKDQMQDKSELIVDHSRGDPDKSGSGNRATNFEFNDMKSPLLHIDTFDSDELMSLLRVIVRWRDAYGTAFFRMPYLNTLSNEVSFQRKDSLDETSGNLEAPKLLPLESLNTSFASSAVFLLSAASYEALLEKIDLLKKYLQQTDKPLCDLMSRATLESESAEWRVAVNGTTRQHLMESINSASSRISRLLSSDHPKLVAVFGCSEVDVYRSTVIYSNLYRKYSSFREIINKFDSLARNFGVYGLKSIIINGHGLSNSNSSIMESLYDCALSVSLCRLWLSTGVKFEAIRTCGKAEYNTAAALGNLSFEDAIRYVIKGANSRQASSSSNPIDWIFDQPIGRNNLLRPRKSQKLMQGFSDGNNAIEVINEDSKMENLKRGGVFSLTLNGQKLYDLSVDAAENFETNLCRLFEAGFNIQLPHFFNHQQDDPILSKLENFHANEVCCEYTKEEGQPNTYNDDFFLLPISATNENSLKRILRSIQKNLKKRRETIAEMEKYLQAQQHHPHYRRAFVVSNNNEEALQEIQKPKQNRIHSARYLGVLIENHLPRLKTEAFCRMSAVFYECFVECCKAFKICPNPSCESILHSAAASYALCKLLLKIGHHNGGIISASNDVLICCAALEILTLDEACDLFKATLYENAENFRKRLDKVRLKRSNTSLKDIDGHPLNDVNSLFQAIQYSNIEKCQDGNNDLAHCSSMFTITSSRDFLNFLGQLYEEGVDLHWSALQRPSDKNNISSPKRIRSPLHSSHRTNLLVIDLLHNPYLFDHAIGGILLLSGATLLILLKKHFNWKIILFKNVDFIAPVIFNATDERIVLQVTSSTSAEVINVRVLHENRLCLKCTATRYVHEIRRRDDTSAEGNLSTDSRSVNTNEFYETMATYGYKHKGTFRSVREVHCSQRRGSVRLHHTDRLDALLDGALQAVVYSYLRESGNNKHMLVPYHIDILSISEEAMTVDSEIVAEFDYVDTNISACLTLYAKTIFVSMKGVSFMMANFEAGDTTREHEGSSQHLNLPSRTDELGQNFGGGPIAERMPQSMNTPHDGENHIESKNMTGFTAERIAITSFACRLPSNIKDLSEFWDALKIGRNVSTRIPCCRIKTRDDLLQGKYGNCIEKANFLEANIAEFEPEFFGISKSEAEKMDPQQRILLECVYGCMENTGLKSLEDVGMFIGVMGAEYANTFERHDDVISMLGSSASVLSGRLNYVFGSNAPSITIDTACSSSLVALNTAVGAILQKQCSKAIVAGVNLMLTEEGFGQRVNGRMLSEDGLCKAFDARADGYGRADGCVALLIEQVHVTVGNNRKVWAWVDANMVNHVGRSVSLTAPNGISQQKLIEMCLGRIHDSPAPSYWETHGTGTLLGDAIEMNALNATLKDMVLGTAKTHIGHTEAAAGACALLKVALQMRYGYIPIHNHFMVSKSFITNQLRLAVIGEEWNGDRAGISCFGVSGTNAVAVLTKDTNICRKQQLQSRLYYVYPISSKNVVSLKRLLAINREMLTECSAQISQLCSTAAFHRQHFRHRSAILLKKAQIQREICVSNPPTRNLRFGIYLEMNGNHWLTDVLYLFHTYTKYRKRFIDIKQQLDDFLKRNALKKIFSHRDCFKIVHQCALILFLNDLGLQISSLNIDDDISLIAAYLFKNRDKNESNPRSTPSPTNFSYVSGGPISESLLTLLQMKMLFKEHVDNTLEWIRLNDLIISNGTICFEEKVARWFVAGMDIRWENFYEYVNYEDILPNYIFDTHEYWHSERDLPFDHPLIGDIVSSDQMEIVFRNQITSLNSPYLFDFLVNDEQHMPYGVCVEAILVAANQLSAGNSKKFRNIITHVSLSAHIMHQKFWMTTRVMNSDMVNVCTVELASTDGVIASGDVHYVATSREVNTKRIKTATIAMAKFYAELKAKGICFKNQLQLITEVSNDETVFKATFSPQYSRRSLYDAMLQVLCYHNEITSENFYKHGRIIKQEIFDADLLENTFDNYFIQFSGTEVIAYSLEGKLLASMSITQHVEKLHPLSTCVVESEKLPNAAIDEKMECTRYNSDALLAKIKAAVGEVLSNGITVDDSQLFVGFTDLGFDSLMITDLANRLRHKYFPDLQISTIDIFEYPNINALLKLIHSRLVDENVSVKPNKPIRPHGISEHPNAIVDASEIINKDSGIHSEVIGSSEPSYSERSSSEEDCIFVQSYFPVNAGIPGFLICLCDYRHGKRNAIIINSGSTSESSYDEATNTWTTKMLDGSGIQKALTHLTDGKTEIAIQFDFHSKFPLEGMTTILLAFSSFVLKSSQMFIILSQPGSGQANAFAIGFSKSLAAENYPRIKFLWNFHLERLNIGDLRKKTLDAIGRQSENWLITGGLSGIGWQMALWLVENRDVCHIILLGRRPLQESKRSLLDAIRRKAEVLVASVDVASRSQMKCFFKKLEFKLTGVIHSAVATNDALASRQTREMFDKATSAKCIGLRLVSKMCDHYGHHLKYFIVNSSVSAVLGNRGQCNYSAANALADEFMRERRACGLPATTVNWGNWLETGMALPVNERLRQVGFNGITISNAMRFLNFVIKVNPEQVIVADLNIDRIVQHRPDLAVVFERLQVIGISKSHSTFISDEPWRKALPSDDMRSHHKTYDAPSNPTAYFNDCTFVDSERRESFVLKSIVESLEMICEMKISSDDYDTGFMDLGLDSLKAYRFISELQEKLACDLNILSIFENPTVNRLSQALRSIVMEMENDCAENKQQTKDSASPNGQLTVFNNFGINIHAHSKKHAQEKVLNLIERLMYSEEDTLSIVRSQEMRFSKDENATSSIFGKSRLQLIHNLLSKQVYLKDTSVNPVLCFVFTGQGSQMWNMGRQLYETFPFFKETFFMTLSLAQTYMPSSDPKLTSILYEWNMRHFLFDTKYAQPIIFCFCYSLAKLFMHFGLEPSFLVGHSISELVAFALSEMIELNDTIRIVVERGKALSGISGKGKMLVVNQNVAKRLRRLTKVDIAAENGPRQIVLAGNNEEIERCIQISHQNGYTSTLLDDRYAFHSSMITSKQLVQLEALCKNIPYKQLDRPYVASNLSGKLERRITADHILQQTQSTVKFYDCIKSLCDAGVNTWLEVGPSETLSTLIRGTTNDRSNTILSSMKPKELEVESLIKALLELEKVGLNVIWSKVYPMERTEPALGNQMEYEKLINDIIMEEDRRLEGLDQHQLNGLPLVPAAFSIFLFLLAANHQSNREQMARLIANLKNVILRKPLHSVHDQELKIKMKNFEIFLTSDGLTCSECKYSRRIESRLQLTIDEHFERNAQYFDHIGFYEGLRRKGLQYGPRLSVVRQMERAERKIVAELINVKCVFVLIDAALQVLAAAVFEENDPHVYVPFEIEFIAVNCDEVLLNNTLKAIGQVTERNERFICGDVDVSDSSGHLICTLRNVTAIAKMSTKSGNRNALRHGRRRNAIKAIEESDIIAALRKKQSQPLTLSMHGTDTRRSDQCNEIVRAIFPSTIMTTAKVESDSSEVQPTIGVVGYAGQFSGLSCDNENLWNNLKTTTQITHSQERSNSKTAPYKVNLLNRQVEYFDAEFFGISPAEAIFIDPQQRLLLEMAQRTLENASLHQLPKDTGIFIAISSNDFAQKAYAEIAEPNAYLAAGTNNSTLAGRIAYWLNVHGPALTIDTACSSFASALASACECIRGGLCEMALVGAANIILNPQSTRVLQQAQMLSPKGICKVFDVDADGYIRSEGVGMVLIKKINPQEHFCGVKIIAYAMGHNGRSGGLTVPNGRSQFELISSAIRQTTLGEISFVEAHATGTRIGDPIEVRAIREAFEKANLNPEIRLCSSKSQLGHCEAAAGVASFLTTLMSLENGYVVPNSHFMLRNEALVQNNTAMITSVFSVGEELNAKRTALMNCFGFSGSNVSLLLSKSESSAPEDGIHRIRHAQFEPYIMVISAHHPKSLSKMKADFVKYIKETDISLPNICAKLQLTKPHYRYRLAAILRNHCKELKFIANETNNKWMKIAFYFDEQPICMTNIANLCENIAKFKEIFIRVYLNYSRSSNRNPIEKAADITLQFVAKLSLLIFLTQIGIYPTVICTRNNFDRIVAEVLLRKATVREWCSAKTVSSTNSENHYGNTLDPLNTWIKAKINEQVSFDQYDCAIDVSRLLFYKGEENAENTVTASRRLANIIASLFVHGIDIKWDKLSDLPCKKCRLPAYPLNEVELWPFHIVEENSSAQINPVVVPSDGGSEDSNLEQSKRSLEERTSQKPTDFRITEQHSDIPTAKLKESIDKAIMDVDVFTEKRIETTTTKWLYELRYLRQALQSSSSRIKFIAINSAKCRQIFPKNCISSVNFQKEDDLMRLLSEQIRECKCGNIVYEWKFMHDDFKNMALQQSIALMQIWQTVDTSIKNNVISAACVNVYSEEIAAYSNGCAALLRSLAAERPSAAYRYIEIDKLDKRFLNELSSNHSENEFISYKNGQRYVQRLCPFVQRSVECPKFKRIMITGGFGGIGKTVIKSLKPELAVILTRRTETDQLTKELVAECGGAVQIKVAQGDCGDIKTIEKVLTEFTPLDVIFHCAGVVENAVMENMNEQKLQRVLHAKVDGVLNLLHICKQCNIRKIVAFSSIAAIFGSAGQANYAFANGLMETLMAPIGNSLTISWGPWDEIGMLAGDEKKLIRKQIIRNGWKFLPPTEAINILIEHLNYNGHIVVLNADFERILLRQQHLSKFLQVVMDVDAMAKVKVVPEKRKIPEEEKVPTYRRGFSRSIVEDVIRRVSGVENIEPDVGFMSMGIDSLMIAQMKEILKQEVNVDLATTVFYDRCTVDSLSAYIDEKVCERKEIQSETYLSKVDTEQVAIIAYSGAFSGAANVDEFWKNLLAGKESITIENNMEDMNVSENSSTIGKFIHAGGLIPDIDKFDHKFWRISHGDASCLDPQIRKFVEHAYFTLEKCGLVNRRKALRIAVLAGAEPSTYGRMDTYRDGTIEKMFAINQKDFVAIWTSHLLDLHGPSFAVYSACSSGLLAVVQAADLLRSGQCDVALAGAASLVLPDAIGHYYQPGMIYSPDGHCRPFDVQSAGTVRGSAVGVVALRLLSEAIRDNNPILAVLEGYCVNNDGKMKSSFTAPNIDGQIECLKGAIASVNGGDVEYVECHGTGTEVGDSIELIAMSEAYTYELFIGSVKANIGHGFAGAGLAGLFKICKIAETRTIPMQINFNRFNDSHPATKFLVPKTNTCINREQFRVAVSSFGIGGTNVHLILRNIAAQKSKQLNNAKQFHLLPISAKTKSSCIALCRAIYEYLNDESELSNVAYTLQNHREHFRYRVAIIAENTEDAKNQLYNINEVLEAKELTNDNIAFFFAPQGVQYARMGEISLKGAPAFSKAMKNCCEIASREIGVDFWRVLYPEVSGSPNGTDNIDRTKQQSFAQCALFSLCFSIVQQLNEWGIQCATMIGHSVGEYSAAVYAGVFSLEEMIRILAYRSRLVATTRNAKMLALRSSPEQLPDGVEVSAVLGKHFKCVVGEPERIDAFKELLVEQGIEYRELATEYGFHSSFMDNILPAFSNFLDTFTCRPPTKKILSNVNGRPIVCYDKDYMVSHMRQPVRLDKCISNLPSNIKVVIEIGPSGIFQNLLKEAGSEITVIETVSSWRQENRRRVHLLNVVGKLWSLGYEIAWSKLLSSHGTFDPNLPNYQFDSIVCWHQRISSITKSARIFQKCWTKVGKFPTSITSLKSILLFLPNKLNSSLQQLLIDLSNRFTAIICVEPTNNKFGLTFGLSDNILQINPSQETSYQLLANHLRKVNFNCSLVFHAWNMLEDFETMSTAQIIEQSFYSISWIKQYLNWINDGDLRIIVAVDNNAPPEVFTVLGPIRELHMTQTLSYGICLSISGAVDFCRLLHQLHFSSWKPKFCHLRCHQNSLEEMNFCETNITNNIDLFYDGDVVIIIGGSGFIGQAFTNFLCKKFKSLIIILISRTANLQLNETQSARTLQKWSTSKQHQFFIYDANIANKEDVNAVFKDILKQHSRINVVIHAAGQPTANKIQKDHNDVEAVFASKIFGTRNVIDALCENNCHIRSFILTSSLSAILGIHGNEDYAAANIFLDEISTHSLYSIDNIVSIEWPAWNDSTMFINYMSNSHDQIAQMIQENSLSTQDYELIFFEAIQHVGCNAISTANPGDIIDELIRIREKPSAITSEDVTIAKLEQSTEDAIKEIWKQCLGVGNISSNDNFFHLGGHSLNGMQVTWQINKRFRCACTVNELFKNPIFADFLAIIQKGLERNSTTVCPPVSDGNSTNVYLPMSNKLQPLKLTFAQENMFLLRNLYAPTLYNIVFSMKFEGNVNRRTLRYALLALIARQTSLRSVFIISEDEHYQECYSLTEAYQNIDWSFGHHDLNSMIQAETRFEFRLDMIPFRIIALETELGECYVIVSQHHIVTDGWSMSVFAKELSEFYRSFTNSPPETSLRPPPLSRHIVDYAIWQRNEQSLTNLEHDLKIVCNRLKDSRATRLLKDRSTSAGAFVNTQQYSFFLPPFLRRRLTEQIALLNTTEYVLMLSAFICLMRKYSDDFVSDEVVIGSAVSGRPFQEMNSIIGYFLNNIVIKVNDVKACAHTREIIRAVEEAVNEARCFEHVPFHRIVAELGQQRNHNGNPLFEIYFNYRHNLEFPVVEIPDTKTTVYQHTSNTIFDFSCTIDETPKGLKITFDYNSSAYYSETILELANEYMRYIAEFGEGQEDIPRTHHIGIFTQDIPGHYCMDTILVKQSSISSSMIAIDDKQSAETYATLVRKASLIAFALKQRYLQHQSESIRADSIIPICMDPNKALIPIVAVLLAGAAYAPLDPENTVNWNAELLANIKPACVISNMIDFNGYSILNPDHIDPLIDRAQLRAHSSAENLVYVIHTSGSTGKQKGVCITHENLVHFIRFASVQMQARPEFRTYHSVNTVFDVSCMNIFTTFANAATLVTTNNRLNAAFEIVEKRINFAYLPSALFSSFDGVQQANLDSLERLFVGGESPSNSALNECLRRGVPIRQIYGPTETTIWSLTDRCTSYEGDDSGARIIGYPTGNQGTLLIDKYGNELSGGKLGELVITGDGVARGYLNIASTEFSDNHNRSREELILNRNGRRYRTGDMVRKLGAKLLFMGRIDCQRKIRGFRVDTTQIEDAIRTFDPAIKNVIVTATEDDNSLVAIIENYKIDEKTLSRFLHKMLPYYMVPQIFISLNKLPLNASGKIDRHKLAKLVLSKKCEVKDKPEVENPKEMSLIETKVADLWKELLQRPNIHLSDNFFDCGGHSLSALKLCNKLRQTLAVELKPTEIFTCPTISSLSELIEKRISFEEETLSPLIPLRESPDSKLNLYAIHAIAGSIFPYYGILSAIPKRFNVFAIEYRKEYKSRTLVDLAHFYVRQVTITNF